MTPQAPIQLFTYQYSGHCHRVEWFLKILQLPYKKMEVNLRAGEQKLPAFLQMNPFGQVPVIKDGDTFVADSNAILIYLAAAYAPNWLPVDPIKAADLQRWLSVAAGLVAYGPAQARAIKLFGRPANLDAAQNISHGLLAKMDAHLAQQYYLIGSQLSLADIANYAYILRAPEGDVSLTEYPAVMAWLKRCEATQNFISMPIFSAV